MPSSRYLDFAHRSRYPDDMSLTRRAVPGGSELKTVCCSFCAKDKAAVTKLVAGPAVYICNECIDLCNLILADEPVGDFTHWDEKSDDDLLADLAKVQVVVGQVDAAIRDYVRTLRDRGISWTRIAEALSVSKQAAWERFSGED